MVNGSKIQWSSPDTNEVLTAIKVFAEDDIGATSESINIQIRYCDCQNGATCNFEKPAIGTNKTADYLRAFCTCDAGWAGQFCENDFDGCEEPSPCPVNCTDKTPAEHKAQNKAFACVGCPTGLAMNPEATKCLDINECDKNPCGNSSRCDNTEGSFECICENGYEKDPNNKNNCLDINECTKGIHDCPFICENNIGNFTCKCPDGYDDKSNDGKNCKILQSLDDKCQNKTSKCESSSKCQFVAGSKETVECVCDNKHVLEAGVRCIGKKKIENYLVRINFANENLLFIRFR